MTIPYRKTTLFALFCFSFLLCVFLPSASVGQTTQSQPSASVYSGQILGPGGQPVRGANVRLKIGTMHRQALTSDTGSFQISVPVSGAATLAVEAAGFIPRNQLIFPGQPVSMTLDLATDFQRVVVTASKTPLMLSQIANTTQVLSAHDLSTSPAISFGDRLEQIAGLQRFRRSSTLVSNPTAQGVSLRGLGSTSASRTLVLANGVPISDPFGGWVNWEQVPTLAISDVEVVSGGNSNLYGSSAIGGVINVLELHPSSNGYEIDTGYGGEDTSHVFGVGTLAKGPWSGMAAGDFLHTGGYIQIAPDVRGPIDVPADVHYVNGELYLRRIIGDHAVASLRGNVLNEARGNGTPAQTNATRTWRYVGGLDWTPGAAGLFALRLFGTQEHYRQSFSSVSDDRTSEALVRLQRVPTQQLGASAQWTKNLQSKVTFVAGAEVDDIRSSDNETPIHGGQPNGLADISARQRDVGEYAEVLWRPGPWTVTGSLRFDDFLNLDAIEYSQTGTGPIGTVRYPNRNETVFSPKLAVVRDLGRYFRLTASAYRAFRSPTLNELYRGFRVGNIVTVANPDLKSERATGWETGTEFVLPGRNTRIQASYFWTEVNRPVTSLTISTTPSLITRQRENLGQIRSRGVSLVWQSAPLTWLSVGGGYQYANATVTRFDQDPQLVGNWIPQVPHNIATLQVRATKSPLGTLALLATESGHQFDDDQNVFLLHGYFQMGAYVSHEFGSRFEVYGTVHNIFDRQIDTGRTPLLTVGMPRVASFGIRLHSLGFRPD